MTEAPRPILYVGELSDGATAGHRLEALRDLGLEVVGLDHDQFSRSAIPKVDGLIRRFPIWPATRGYGKAVLKLAERHDAGVVWFDKPTLLDPAILTELRRQDRYTVHYTVDDATGRAPEWSFRNILAGIPAFDLSLVSRRISVEEYQARGAQDVRYFQLAYDDDLHRPPPEDWSEANRPIDVMFIGGAHDDRPGFLERLWREHGIRTHVLGGDPWRPAFAPDARKALLRGPPVYGEAYTRAIWSAKICLSFITHGNRDDVAHRSFELAACGAAVVAERSFEQESVFEPDLEMVFFSSVEECAAAINRLVGDPARRLALGEAARARALRDGYGNRATLKRVLDYIGERRPDIRVM